jgi:acetyl-CoA/propionyl-CoA carboxylase carboxyl transferase subunit
MNHMEERIDDLMERRKVAMMGGGADRIAKHHAKGRYTARERLDLLLDEGLLRRVRHAEGAPLHSLRHGGPAVPGDGVVTGYGTIDGRLVYVYAFDATVFGGSLSETVAEKICKVMDLAAKNGAPLIGLNDSGGARIQEGSRAWPAIPTSSSATSWCPAWCRSSPASSGPAPAAPSTPRPSPTSRSWWRAARTCSSPARRGEVGHARGRGHRDAGRRAGPHHAERRGPPQRAQEEEAIEQLKRLLSFMPSNNLGQPPRRDDQRPAGPASAEALTT